PPVLQAILHLVLVLPAARLLPRPGEHEGRRHRRAYAGNGISECVYRGIYLLQGIARNREPGDARRRLRQQLERRIPVAELPVHFDGGYQRAVRAAQAPGSEPVRSSTWPSLRRAL